MADLHGLQALTASDTADYAAGVILVVIQAAVPILFVSSTALSFVATTWAFVWQRFTARAMLHDGVKGRGAVHKYASEEHRRVDLAAVKVRLVGAHRTASSTCRASALS